MNDTENRRAWLRSLIVGIAFLLTALIASRATSAWIASTYPDRPRPRDLLFETLPYVPKAGYIADLAVVVALVVLLIYAFSGNSREIPMFMGIIGVMYLTRAFMNVLTPLASPLDPGTYYGISVELEHALRDVLSPLLGALQSGGDGGSGVSAGIIHFSQNGEFPSGHMAIVLLCMLLVNRAKAPRMRSVIAVLVVVEAVTLLMSHQHYSIDVLGGLLLSYFIYHEYTEGTWFNWLKPLVRV